MIRTLWMAFHVISWTGLIIFALEQLFAPTSWWIVIRKITIDDGVVGGLPPLVSVDRTIYRPFVVHWTTELRKVDPEDTSKYVTFCQTSGVSSEEPGQQLPPNVNVDFWLNRGNKRCPPLTVGKYYARVIGEWQDFLATRILVTDSESFLILDKPEPLPPSVVIERKPVIVQNKTVVNKKTVVIKQQSLFPSLFSQPHRQLNHHRGR